VIVIAGAPSLIELRKRVREKQTGEQEKPCSSKQAEFSARL
jgi:hypothetical protein